MSRNNGVFLYDRIGVKKTFFLTIHGNSDPPKHLRDNYKWHSARIYDPPSTWLAQRAGTPYGFVPDRGTPVYGVYITGLSDAEVERIGSVYSYHDKQVADVYTLCNHGVEKKHSGVHFWLPKPHIESAMMSGGSHFRAMQWTALSADPMSNNVGNMNWAGGAGAA